MCEKELQTQLSSSTVCMRDMRDKTGGEPHGRIVYQTNPERVKSTLNMFRMASHLLIGRIQP